MNILKSATTKLGNKIELIGEPSDKNILVIGVFHGDEPQGKYLIEQYLSNIPPLPNPPPRGGREYKQPQYSFLAKIKSKELRKSMTNAEQILWYFLRGNRLNGLHFKRQQPIGKYIVDFVCFSKKLIIELDGSQHENPSQKLHDIERTKFLEENNFKVIRILDNDVFKNIEGTINYILNSLFHADGDLGREDENYSLYPANGDLGRGGKNYSLPPARGRVRERGVLFIPCLNPDGMQKNTRTNANGVDLNRNFPTKNWGQDGSAAGENPSDYFGGESAGSEIETKFVINVIKKYKPEAILTLHAPYKIVNYDGPAKDISQKISEIIGYPVEESIGYPTPGSFGTYCGVERNIPTITLELDEKIPVENLVQPVFEIFDMFNSISF